MQRRSLVLFPRIFRNFTRLSRVSVVCRWTVGCRVSARVRACTVGAWWVHGGCTVGVRARNVRETSARHMRRIALRDAARMYHRSTDARKMACDPPRNYTIAFRYVSTNLSYMRRTIMTRTRKIPISLPRSIFLIFRPTVVSSRKRKRKKCRRICVGSRVEDGIRLGSIRANERTRGM